MSDGLLTTQDLSFKECVITSSSGQQLDIKNIVVEFHYFEDIFAGGVSGMLVINDSMGYINILQLQGSEVLTIKLDKPGLDLPIIGNYRIYTISTRNQTNDTNQNYVLRFCSEELFINEQYRIAKSYTKQVVSDIISDICLNVMKIPKNRVYIEQTKGLRDIVIPNFKPIQAANWLSTFALSSNPKNIGAPFLFYEDRDGWKFNSILTLFQQPVYKTYQYNAKGLKSESNPMISDLGLEIVDVIQYEHVKSFDSVQAARAGVFANKMHTVDPLRLKLGESNFNYSQYISSNPAILNEHIIPTTATDRFGNTMMDATAAVKFCVTTTGQNKNEYIKKRTSVNETLIEQTVPLRTAQIALFCINRMKILIPGDVYMTVGRIIIFNLPQISYESNSRQKKSDEYYSGKYLVTAVRHILNQEGNYVTCVEICKESTPTAFGSFNNSNPEWNNLRTQ